MRKDLIIALAVAIAVHVTLLFGLNRRPTVAHHAVQEQDDIPKIEMPPIVQDEPEKQKSDEPVDEDVVQVNFAPPSLVDIPNVAADTAAFVQETAPPPPPGIETAKGVVTIPANPRPASFGKGLANLFDISQLDQIPVAQVQQQPIYPYEMRRAGITGEVNVGFIVNLRGEVQDAYVMNSTHREFEMPAVQAVSKWKFRPGRKGGRAVNTKMSVPIVFSFND
jgi:protein TonB